ncbi:MAG: FkbM family methyltransferase [Alphaproteobacteria bacterium]|nr:MAG: FkbM family methyltransferase [Caulobacteraceae bacterium]TPW08125.1 MAG: FkbM family methyltransferase [Alphaproteobacteria bacterium]
MFHNPRKIVAKLAEGLEISGAVDRLDTMAEEYRLRFGAIEKPREDVWWFEGGGAGSPAARKALRGVVRAGQTVFDVGANVGGFSRLASRLVGPRGMVCAFEVSPRILPILSGNLMRQNAWNTTVYAAAVHERSMMEVDVFHSRFLNDRIVESAYEKPAGTSKAMTMSIDDFVAETGFTPDIIKIDVEDAEWLVVKGAVETIRAHAPTIILDNSSTNSEYWKLLTANGYRALNALTYATIETPADMASNLTCSHILFLPEARATQRTFPTPCRFKDVASIPSIGFRLLENTWGLARPLRLEPGRYVVDAAIEADRHDDNMLIQVDVGGRTAVRYEGASAVLASDIRYWVFDVPVAADVAIRFEFLQGDPRAGFSIDRIRVRQVEGFENLAMSYLIAP